MRRGELYWASFAPRSGSEQRGRRPAVVVSNDGFNKVESWRSTIVLPVTISSRQGLRGPSVVHLSAAKTGLPQDSYVLCHQINALDRSKLEERIGRLADDDLRRISEGIRSACELPVFAGK